VAHVLATLEPLERRVVRDDDSAHYILRVLPYREPDSAVSGALLTFVDVSTIVQAEEALVEADVRKTFSRHAIARVAQSAGAYSHRRTTAPFAQCEAERDQEAQAIIARQVTHMSRLLDDLLDVARITRGVFLLKKEYADLRVLMDSAVEAVRPAMDAKQHTFSV